MTALLLILRQSGLLLTDLLPWILAGCGAGALLRTVRRLPFEEKLAGAGPWAIPLAAVSGAASPLCTLGSVPVISGLTARGLPRAAGFAFLDNSHLPLVKAFSQKFKTDQGSPECRFLQQGSWFFYVGGASAGTGIASEFKLHGEKSQGPP